MHIGQFVLSWTANLSFSRDEQIRKSRLGLFATMVAANIGAGSTVGASGLGYRDGLSAWWWVGSAAMGSLVLAFAIGPQVWRIARDRDLRTVGDFLEHRYGRSVRAVITLLLWIGTLAAAVWQVISTFGVRQSTWSGGSGSC